MEHMRMRPVVTIVTMVYVSVGLDHEPFKNG